jgi:hypothetical protein
MARAGPNFLGRRDGEPELARRFWERKLPDGGGILNLVEIPVAAYDIFSGR